MYDIAHGDGYYALNHWFLIDLLIQGLRVILESGFVLNAAGAEFTFEWNRNSFSFYVPLYFFMNLSIILFVSLRLCLSFSPGGPCRLAV